MAKQVRKSQVFGEYSRRYYELEGSIDSVIELLSKARDRAVEDGWSELFVDWDTGYGSDDVSWCIKGDRLETDREEEDRLKLEARVKEARKKDKKDREAKDLAEYERLRKKFGDK